jgi:hypothetical protein
MVFYFDATDVELSQRVHRIKESIIDMFYEYTQNINQNEYDHEYDIINTDIESEEYYQIVPKIIHVETYSRNESKVYENKFVSKEEMDILPFMKEMLGNKSNICLKINSLPFSYLKRALNDTGKWENYTDFTIVGELTTFSGLQILYFDNYDK